MILYTLLKMDGTEEELAQVPKEVELSQLYKWLNCTTIELIPNAYYKEDWANEAIVWGDEEGRFNSENKRNPHMKVLNDNTGAEWDCVGNLILQTEC